LDNRNFLKKAMTKKDYEFFANPFGNLLAKSENDVPVLESVNVFCNYAQNQNPKFNETIFRRICLEIRLNSTAK